MRNSNAVFYQNPYQWRSTGKCAWPQTQSSLHNNIIVEPTHKSHTNSIKITCLTITLIMYDRESIMNSLLYYFP